MQSYTYHFPLPNGTTLDFNQPYDIEEYDKLVSAGVQPLSLALIIFSRSIERPDGTRVKVFSRWTKERFRKLMADYDTVFINNEVRSLLVEYWAGYSFTNPIGLLIHRITRHAVEQHPAL